MPVTLTAELADTVFNYAQRICSYSASPDNVRKASVPLIDWLQQATDKVDLNVRAMALNRAHQGRCGDLETRGQDDPVAFVEEAEHYYTGYSEANETAADTARSAKDAAQHYRRELATSGARSA